jgi:hypothetical protein
MMGELNRSGLEDDAIGRPYPAIQVDPGQFFHQWVTKGEVRSHEDGSPNMSFFAVSKDVAGSPEQAQCFDGSLQRPAV